MRTMRVYSPQSHSRLCKLSEVPQFFNSQIAGPQDKSKAVGIASAAIAGASEAAIMRQTRHRSLTTVRRKIRDGSLFRKNAAAVLGL